MLFRSHADLNKGKTEFNFTSEETKKEPETEEKTKEKIEEKIEDELENNSEIKTKSFERRSKKKKGR